MSSGPVLTKILLCVGPHIFTGTAETMMGACYYGPRHLCVVCETSLKHIFFQSDRRSARLALTIFRSW